MAEGGEDFYQILGLTFDTFDEKKLKDAYKKLSRKYHPDKNEGKESEMFHRIQRAYNILSDETKKAEFDKGIKAKIFKAKKEAEMDVNRKRMKTKLEEREREVKRRKMEEEKRRQEKERERERLRREGYASQASNININNNINNNVNKEENNIKNNYNKMKKTTMFSRETGDEKKDKSFAELFEIEVPTIEQFLAFEEKTFRHLSSFSSSL